jgi:hypothetical protein
MNTYRINLASGKVFIVKRFGNLASLSEDLGNAKPIDTETGRILFVLRHISHIEVVSESA